MREKTEQDATSAMLTRLITRGSYVGDCPLAGNFAGTWTHTSELYTLHGLSFSLTPNSRMMFEAIRACALLPPAIANISPAKYSNFTSALRSSSRYSSGGMYLLGTVNMRMAVNQAATFLWTSSLSSYWVKSLPQCVLAFHCSNTFLSFNGQR